MGFYKHKGTYSKSNEIREKDYHIHFTSHVFLFTKKGFTLLEVLISVALISGLLVTLIYTLNYHLGIAERHEVITQATFLAKGKMYEMEKNPSVGKGQFSEPYSGFSFETRIKESVFPGMIEIAVIVKRDREEVQMGSLVRKSD